MSQFPPANFVMRPYCEPNFPGLMPRASLPWSGKFEVSLITTAFPQATGSAAKAGMRHAKNVSEKKIQRRHFSEIFPSRPQNAISKSGIVVLEMPRFTSTFDGRAGSRASGLFLPDENGGRLRIAWGGCESLIQRINP